MDKIITVLGYKNFTTEMSDAPDCWVLFPLGDPVRFKRIGPPCRVPMHVVKGNWNGGVSRNDHKKVGPVVLVLGQER